MAQDNQLSNGDIRAILVGRCATFGWQWLEGRPAAIGQALANRKHLSIYSHLKYLVSRLLAALGIAAMVFILSPYDAQLRSNRGVVALENSYSAKAVFNAVFDISLQIEGITFGLLAVALLFNADLVSWLQKAASFLSTSESEYVGDTHTGLAAKSVGSYHRISFGVGALSTALIYVGKHGRSTKTAFAVLGLGVYFTAVNSIGFGLIGWLATWNINAADDNLLKPLAQLFVWLVKRELFWWGLVVVPWFPGFQRRHVSEYRAAGEQDFTQPMALDSQRPGLKSSGAESEPDFTATKPSGKTTAWVFGISFRKK